MRKIEPRAPLEVLDPAYGDPGYWQRFQNRIMDALRPQLVARRERRVTVESVMLSWSRLVVPATVAAAAVAGALLLPQPRALETEEVAGVEEVIGIPADGEAPLPSFLHSDEVVDRDVVLLAVEQF